MAKNHRLFVAASLLAYQSVATTAAWAYPPLARHGYTTCVTCHHNPSGGGVLTSYGKFIAGELFGMFNDSSSALPWIVEPKEDPLFVGMAMSRVAQTYFDTPQVKRSDFRKMQFDFEGGVIHKGWQAMATIGPRLDSAIEGKQSKYNLALRRFWVGLVQLEYAFRVGKFFPEYGINHYNHNIPTRKGLFFNHNEEPLIAQGSWFTTTIDATLAFLSGSKDTQLEDKRGYSGTLAYKLGTTTRFGYSRLDVKGDKGNSGANGLFVQHGYLEKGYLLAEIDRKSKTNPKGHKTDENLAYLENGWEFFKGFNPYIAYEHSQNLGSGTVVKTPELGLQLHPLTHAELIFQAGKSFMKIAGEDKTAVHGFMTLNLFF